MKLSIITPSFNQHIFLGAALQSILSQRGGFELELLVIDGASTDGSVELLEQINDDRVVWVSEPDGGQADALNKGFARATGDVVAWLNSDDLYVPGALAAVVDAFENHGGARWIVGRCEIIDAQDHVIRRGITRYKERALRRYRYGLLLRENFISQMAVFWRREFFESVGPLDESLRYTMDYDLWLRMGAQADPLVLDRVLARFRVHREGKGRRHTLAQFSEQYRVACRYLGGKPLARVMHLLNVIKVLAAYGLMRLCGR